ncbi:MAG: alpha-L-fucosidase, partial [Pedobacter sp.]
PRANITKEVFNAFRKENFMMGAYFSKSDWNNENFWWSYFPVKDRGVNYDILKYPDRWKKFNDFTYNQVEELMNDYGKVDILWFDGQPRMEMSSIVEMARKDQPGIIIVNRFGKPEYIDYLTPEQTIPEAFIPYPWETCLTMGRAWSYNKNEKYKPARKLVQILVDIVAKNGNLLLNVGPGPDGELHKEAYDRLEEIGKWIKVNGESIYGTKPVFPYRKDKWAFTGKDKIQYVSYLPDEKELELAEKVMIPVSAINKNAKVTLLGTAKPLKWTKVDDQIQVEVPQQTISQFSGQPVWVFKII